MLRTYLPCGFDCSWPKPFGCFPYTWFFTVILDRVVKRFLKLTMVFSSLLLWCHTHNIIAIFIYKGWVPDFETPICQGGWCGGWEKLNWLKYVCPKILYNFDKINLAHHVNLNVIDCIKKYWSGPVQFGFPVGYYNCANKYNKCQNLCYP